MDRIKMANNKEISIDVIAQIATLAAKTTIDKILERRQEDVFTRHRGDIKGMRHRHNGCSPVYTYADKVKNTLHNQKTYKAENILVAKGIKERPIIIQAEHEEDIQTVNSLQFCNLKKCKDENVEEWMKRLRTAAEECKYHEQDRQVKEQFICGLNNECMQAKIISEIKAKGKADSITSKQVVMLAMQQEASMMQIIGARQTEAQMMRTSTCRYCGSSHLPRTCPAYGMTCGECSRVNHFSTVCRAPRQVTSRQGEQDNGQTNKVKNNQVIHNYIYVKACIETKINTTSFYNSIDIRYKLDTYPLG